MDPYDFPELFEFVVVGQWARQDDERGVKALVDGEAVGEFVPIGTVVDDVAAGHSHGRDVILGTVEGRSLTLNAGDIDWRPVLTGPELVRRRDAAGLTQVQLAKLLGVEKGTLSRWERGVAAITAPGAVALALQALEAQAK